MLELVHDKLGESSFMDIAKIYFTFPKEVVDVSDKMVSIIKELAKKDAVAKGFIKILISKNPSKYWDMRKSAK